MKLLLIAVLVKSKAAGQGWKGEKRLRHRAKQQGKGWNGARRTLLDMLLK